jgi:site-specific DNA recombinase
LFRFTRDCVQFAEWAEQHGKVLVFAEDGMTLNYRDKGTPGAIESIDGSAVRLARFVLRTIGAQQVQDPRPGRAPGSQADRPLGYQGGPHPSGKGKGLDTDPEGRELLYGMASRLLDGWSFVRIAAWLNESGALTNMDRARVAKGQEAKRRPWTVSTVIYALTSPRTHGLKMHKRETVLDGDGDTRCWGSAPVGSVEPALPNSSLVATARSGVTTAVDKLR